MQTRKKGIAGVCLTLCGCVVAGSFSGCSLALRLWQENNGGAAEVGAVASEYFTYLGYEKKENGVVVKGSCSVSLSSLSAEVEMYSAEYEYLGVRSLSLQSSLHKGKEFALVLPLSASELSTVEFLEVEYSGKTDGAIPAAERGAQRFVGLIDGEKTRQIVVRDGERLATPASPEKEGYVFDCWRYGDEGTEYDFSAPVTADFVLYADYTIDYKAWTNRITDETVDSCVTVLAKDTAVEDSRARSGSGFVFFDDETYYYAITNNHVVGESAAEEMLAYRVRDYKGNIYDAELVTGHADYDLAVIKFEKKEDCALDLLPIATEDPAEGEEIAVVGQPEGQINAVTFGEVKGYGKATLKDTPVTLSNVTFETIVHGALTKNGSSGSPVFNYAAEVVAVHYAGRRKETGEFVKGYAIPAEKVWEFLNEYFY